MFSAVLGFNFLFFVPVLVLVLSSNNGWYQFRGCVSVVGLIHCPLLWAWKFLSDLRSPTEFGTLSTISVCLRVCLNLCTYMKSFWCLFRRRSWKTTMPGSWTHWRASNRPIRVQRKLWVQKRWKLDLTNSLFNLSWKIQRCRLAPVWSVVPYLCSLNDHYNITSIVVIFLWGGGGVQVFTMEWNVSIAERKVLTLKFECLLRLEVGLSLIWLLLCGGECCFSLSVLWGI